MHPRHSTAFHLVWLACAVTGSAYAQDTPPFVLSASVERQTDDNLLRLPDSAPDSSDVIYTSTLGVLFYTNQSLQRFELEASVVNYRYQNFSELGYTGRNYMGAWRWAVTPRVHGVLSATQSEMPGETLGNTQPNQQKRNNLRADAEYEIDGVWRVLAGVSKDRAESQTVDATGTQFSANAVDAGVRYDAGSGSFAKYSVKASDGAYLNNNAAPGNLGGDGYRQLDNDFRVRWVFSGKSSADFNATHVDRRHDAGAVRNFSGLNYGTRLNWGVSAKSTLVLAYAYTLAPYLVSDPAGNVAATYTGTDQLSWAWNWQMSAHTRLQLQQAFQQVAYLGAPVQALQSTRSDDNRDTSITLIWQPRRQWQVSAGLHQIQRDSSEAFRSYVSNQARLAAQFSY